MAETKDLVDEFLRESAAAERLRLRRTWAIVVSVLAVVTVLALVATWFAIRTNQQASDLETAATTDVLRLIELSTSQAETEQERDAAQEAQAQAEIAKETAQADRVQAEQQADLANARRLAAQARNLLEDNPPLALLLALEAQRIVQTDEATQVIAEVPYYYSPSARMMIKHDAPVTSVAWNPEGSYLASGSGDQTIILWDAISGQPVITLESQNEPIADLAWHPDGSQLASSYGDNLVLDGKAVIIWDIANGQPATALLADPLSQWGAGDIAWSSDGSRLAAATPFLSLVWDLASGQVISELEGHVVGLSSASEITAVDLSPDGSRLASGGDDHQLLIWDLTHNEPIMSLEGHTGPVTAIAWSPDGSLLASGSGDHWAFLGDNTIVLWDIDEGEGSAAFWDNGREFEVMLGTDIATLRGHLGGVNSVAWSPDGTILASGANDNRIILWQVPSGQRLATLYGHMGQVTSVAFSPDGSKLASGSTDNTVIEWKITNDQLANSLERHSGEITSLVWSPDGRLLASGSADASIIVWDAASGKPVTTLTGHRLTVQSLAWSPDSSQLASGTLDRMPYGSNLVWDVASGDIVQMSEIDADGCGAVAWDPSGTYWAESTGAGVGMWDFADDRFDIPPELMYKCIGAMDVSSDGSQLVMGDSGGNLLLWEITSSSLITLGGRVEGISSVAWSPDGTRVAAAGATEIAVWDIASAQLILTLPGHGSVAWSPDGTRIVSPGEDNRVVVWDTTNGQQITVLAGHASKVNCVAWSPDGARLATGGADSSILLINTRFLDPPCHWALRNMSLEEWQEYSPDEEYRKTCPELPSPDDWGLTPEPAGGQ